VDAKIFINEVRGVTGKGLFLVLTVSLTCAALLLDWNQGLFFKGAASFSLPFIVTAIATFLVGKQVVPMLQALKAGQFIREDGPRSHYQKAGTPTMGGIFFVPTAVAIAILWSGFAPEVVAVGLLTLSYAAIGWLDDWQILRRRSNKGISPRLKLLLQIAVGGVFCLWAFSTQSADLTTLALPLGLTLPLGGVFWLVGWFALVAESNATNLTDGLDGLAGGTAAIALMGLAALVAPTSLGLMIFCAAMSGACVGFLGHNRNPARVFMGDTGSLALGGALAASALLSQHLFGLLVLSGLFFVETLSVIAQVGYYKATKDENGVGKRLLKMAPLHHHLELVGWTETQIVARFYLIGGILAIAYLSLMVPV
jgi:phospho-N-acetylmuramoyl-pentapeptide-transferase